MFTSLRIILYFCKKFKTMNKKYTKEILEEAVSNCTSFRQLVLYLNLKETGGNYENLKNRCKEFEIDTSHFTGKGWHKAIHPKFGRAVNLEERFRKHSKKQASSKTKEVLLNQGLREYKCEICGISEWLGKPITLQLHHIDGDPTNDTLENLQILCPNCHSQTDSYCRQQQSRNNMS